MSRFTYGTSAIFALSGTAIAVYGVIAGECKPLGAGLVLLLGASVFALLYLGFAHQRAASDEITPGTEE